jgi:hypothetical protein
MVTDIYVDSRNIGVVNKCSWLYCWSHDRILSNQHDWFIFRIVRFQVVTAVTIKNAVFWDIKTPDIPHKKYITPA